MVIAIRKENNGRIYIDKNYFNRFSELRYGFSKAEVPAKYIDEIMAIDFNDDLTFNVEKFNARKQKENILNYNNLIVDKIREKYDINQELAILRQKDTKPEEFAQYFDYIEKCKSEAKIIFDETIC